MRVIFWFFVAVLALGFGLSGWIVVNVYLIDASPGARMKLIVVMWLLHPMLAASLGTIGVVSSDGGLSLRRWERQIGWVMSSLTLVVYGVLVALG